MNFLENIRVALSSIRTNLLRSILTLLIISVGIACLVGILTAIDTILFNLSDNFNRIGANSFSVLPGYENIQSNRDGKERKQADVISYKQAMQFKDMFGKSTTDVSISMNCSRSATVKYKDKKSNPTIKLEGIDDKYLDVSSSEIALGRNFNATEVQSASNKAIIAEGMVKLLFQGENEKAIGQVINISSEKYKVIGVLESKGNSMGGSENVVYIPLLKAKQKYGTSNTNYMIMGAVGNSVVIEDAVSSAIGTLRNVRKLKASEQNDFRIRTSDGILSKLKDITTELRVITIVIALLTLVGAAIGLMNIMLVSVTERTKEIGVRKAMGATQSNILLQFLTEAVVICILGGIVGIVLGIGMGLGVTALVKGTFVLPVQWIALGIFVCVFVGVVSGLYPAMKASRLDPIEALRYE